MTDVRSVSRQGTQNLARRYMRLPSSVIAPVIGIWCLLILGGCTSVNPQAQPPAPGRATYRVGPPDRLEITVLPDPVIERALTVRPDGRISFDLIGDVEATGRTTTEIANDIEQRIVRFKRDASVSVRVALSQTNSVTIYGEVGSPGAFPLEREMRIADAIGSRGGPTIFASEDAVRVIRVVEDETYVILADIAAIQRGDLGTNIMLQGGDIVVVPPNFLAKIGYAVQLVLFPFTPVLGTGLSAATTAGVGR